MGGFFGSIHLKAESRESVVEALAALARRFGDRFLVAPVMQGWITVYPSGSGQDERVSRRIARRASGDLVHLISHDDDVFLYFVYREGRLIDRYSSRPDYFRPVSRALCRKLVGRPEAFGHLFADRRQVAAFRRLLVDPGSEPLSSSLMVRFAEGLGLPGEVMTSYECLREEAPDGIENWEQFIHVPDRSKEDARERKAAAEVVERKDRLKRERMLLVERVTARPGGAPGYPIVCPDRANGFWVCADAGNGGGLVPVERYAPPWSNGPSPTALTVDSGLWALESSPSGRYLLAPHGSRDDWRVEIWDMEKERLAETVRHPRGRDWYGFLPDETGWVGVSPKQVVVARLGRGNEPVVWKIEHGKHAAIHPSGMTLVVADQRNRLLFVDLTTGRVPKTLLLGGVSQKTGLVVLAQFVPGIGEAMRQLAEELGAVALGARMKRRQCEAAQLVTEEVVRSGRMPDEQPDPETARYRETFRARLVDVMANARAEHLRATGGFSFIPDVSAPEQFDALSVGATSSLSLAFDGAGQWLCCGTDTGVEVYSWRELLTAVSVTPPPQTTAKAAPFVDDFDDGADVEYGHVCGLAHDGAGGRFLFATMGGKVGFLEPDAGRSGVLLDVPGRPPIMRVYLSRDRGALGITCHPDRFGRRRAQHRPFIQIWDYQVLERGILE